MGDLSDAEVDELASLLEQTPEPYRPLDVVALDGYLASVLVQPRLVEREEWLPGVFDLDGAALPGRADAQWRARCEALVMRRYDALRGALEDEGAFDPLLPQPGDDALDAELADVAAPSRALIPWLSGFVLGVERFGGLLDAQDDAVSASLARVLRHLPAVDAAAREINARLDGRLPLDDEEAAVADLVDAVAELYDLTHARRWQVATVRRETPKVGRNDRCPCGSGRKYKHCHGER